MNNKFLLFLIIMPFASQAMVSTLKQTNVCVKTAQQDKNARAKIRKQLNPFNKSSEELTKEELVDKIQLLKQLRRYYTLSNKCHTKQRTDLRTQAKYLTFILHNPNANPKMPGHHALVSVRQERTATKHKKWEGGQRMRDEKWLYDKRVLRKKLLVQEMQTGKLSDESKKFWLSMPRSVHVSSAVWRERELLSRDILNYENCPDSDSDSDYELPSQSALYLGSRGF